MKAGLFITLGLICFTGATDSIKAAGTIWEPKWAPLLIGLFLIYGTISWFSSAIKEIKK